MTTPQRTCPLCGATKPACEFPTRRRRLAGGGTSISYESRCKPCKRRRDRDQQRARNGYVGKPEETYQPREWLPVEPFREWIRARVEKYESLTEFSAACGVSLRSIDRVLRENNTHTDLGFVDRCLCSEGSTFLAELYPEVYEFEVAA